MCTCSFSFSHSSFGELGPILISSTCINCYPLIQEYEKHVLLYYGSSISSITLLKVLIGQWLSLSPLMTATWSCICFQLRLLRLLVISLGWTFYSRKQNKSAYFAREASSFHGQHWWKYHADWNEGWGMGTVLAIMAQTSTVVIWS